MKTKFLNVFNKITFPILVLEILELVLAIVIVAIPITSDPKLLENPYVH